MTEYSPSGGMIWNPYKKGVKGMVYRLRDYNTPHARAHFSRLGGEWVHNPYHVYPRAVTGAGLATTVGVGNFMTRGFRQKPIVALQKAEHRRVAPAPPAKRATVDIPTVSNRRVKNKLLTTSKAMPYRRSFKRPRRRRVVKKGRRSMIRRLPPLTLPRSRVVRFRAVQPYAWTSAGAIAVVAAKANSLNDPFAGFGSALPLGTDQWSSQYQKYIVLGSKITVRAMGTTNTGIGIVGIHLTDTASALANASHYKELPLTKQKLITTQKDYAVVKNFYKAKKFWRLTNIKDDSEQEAVFSTTPGDPTDIAYYHVYISDLVGSNNFNADLQIEMEWICLLTDPVTLAQSSL